MTASGVLHWCPALLERSRHTRTFQYVIYPARRIVFSPAAAATRGHLHLAGGVCAPAAYVVCRADATLTSSCFGRVKRFGSFT